MLILLAGIGMNMYEWLLKVTAKKKKLILGQKKTVPSEMFQYFKDVLHTSAGHQLSALWHLE